MREEEITFQSGEFTLAGTLSLPDGEGLFPAVLFISGSGQVDRNENHRQMPINLFNTLAERFAGEGFASLRFDKRGVGSSGGSFLTTGFFDNIADATSAFHHLQKSAPIDPRKIFILGHSEGALIASAMAGREVPAAGIILLAGTAQRGEEVLAWQASRIAAYLKGFQGFLVRTLRIDPLKSQRKVLAKIAASDKDTIRIQLIVKINAKWMREFMAYNPAEDLPKATCPVLAVTGEHDIQVDPTDINRMEELVSTPFEGHILPELSHILRQGPPGLGDYKRQLTQPPDEGVVSLVTEWLGRQSLHRPDPAWDANVGVTLTEWEDDLDDEL
jgi:uncharacterized protein